MNRRQFLLTTGAAAAALSARAATVPAPAKLHIATNTYPWGTYAKREKRDYVLHTPSALDEIASTGITGYEPAIKTPAEFDGLAERLRQRGLEMRSLYVNSVLHEPDQARQSIDEVLAIARRAAETGTKIIVTNPAPIRWGEKTDKTDPQLITQAKSLDLLGAELGALGITLAYHNHESELRQGAREFHHMRTATDPRKVKLCLDAHWIFRGCGDSQVALFDAVENYGSRIVELHLRQSQGGVWTETFDGAGDIDYARLAAWLKAKGLKPLLVLEQAVEARSTVTIRAVEAHRRNRVAALATFAGLL